MTNQEALELLKRDAVSIYSEDGLKERLFSGKPLKIKMGADPSRPDLHLGHSVVLRKLRMLQELGHEIIFVIGDFTGMIGDPSGRIKARQPLTFEQTRKNGESYLAQVTKILDRDKTQMRYNSDWLAKMHFADVLQLAGKYTVARIMERDDFAKRFSGNQPIGIHEMLYPLMQGYDSVALCADIEVGGTDQTFNLLVGRELQKDYHQTPQEVMTFPILIGLDGVNKMSKSLDNYIGLDENPGSMFEKCMKVPDHILADYFRLTTDLPPDCYQPLLQNNIRKAHIVYAEEIVTMYHGKREVEEAYARYKAVASGSIPDEIETIILNRQPPSVIELIRSTGFASSNSEARRLIAGGGIKINGSVVDSMDFTIDANTEFVIQKGRNRFKRVIVKEE